jgi:hypothetical protein
MFCILSLFSLDNSRFVSLQMQHRSALSGLGNNTIAHENLPRAAEMFEVSIPVEDQGFPVERMTKLKAWKDLNDTLSAYAKRIELMEEQNAELRDKFQHRTEWTSWAGLAMISLELVFIISHGRAVAQDRRTAGKTSVETVPGE